MYEGKLVFSQLMDHLPQQTFRRHVERYGGDRSVRTFSCQDQFRCMAFAQLTRRTGVRHEFIALSAHAPQLAEFAVTVHWAKPDW
jgi:Domain of unknown function (DUF4372)